MNTLLILMFITVPLLFSQSLSQKKAKAVDLVNRGIQHIERVGADKAFMDFSDKSGPFIEGEYYLFVVDYTGLTLAHGGKASLVGKNMYELKDPDGVYFIQNFIKLAQSKTEGWSSYKWAHPIRNKIEPKLSYTRKVPGMDAFIGCGFYKK